MIPWALQGQDTEAPAATPAGPPALAPGEMFPAPPPPLEAPAASTPAPTRTNPPPAASRPAATAPPAGGVGDLASHAREGPVDISSSGNTTFKQTPQGRIATATRGVTIQTSDTSIYCDHAEYNVDTHEADLTGNVRIYRLDTSILANHAVYNFDTKAVRALDFDGARPPFEFGGVSVFSPGAGAQYNVRQGTFTTDDASEPDFHISAQRIRVYPDNRIVYIGSKLYIGTTPVFYFPYFYQSLDQQSGYTVTPGYTSVFGAYLLTGVTFPVTEHLTGLARVDYRSERGLGLGLNLEYKPNRRPRTTPDASGVRPYASDDNPAEAAVVTTPQTSPNNATTSRATPGSENDGANGSVLSGEARSRQIRNREGLQLLTYYVHDDKPDLNRTSLDRLPVDQDRYRVKLSGAEFLTDDLFFKVDVDKISDRYLLQDFYEGEFTRNPNPENVIFLTYYHPNFVTTLTARAQLNDFFNTTERLPELAFDVPRQPLWNSGFFYEGESTAGYLRRTFDNQGPLPEYSAVRLDTFHQISYAKTLFDWLSVTPRVGLRGTYYSHSAPANDAAYDLQNVGDDTGDRILFDASDPTNLNYLALRSAIKAFKPRGDVFRPVVNAGVELSFKASRVYDVESRFVGLDQIQHVVQPYVDFQEVEDFGVDSRRLLQFDRRLPSTQLQPIDFPQQTTIDSIDNETVARLGVRNRLQTRRDALTFNWLETDTFFQVGNDPNQRSNVSNLFNQVTLRPLPWITLTVNSQLPVFNGRRGFTEVDTTAALQATRNLDITLSHRYLNDNPFFVNSSLVRLSVYYRLDDNWAASFSERYEFADHTLQAQSYTIYRDLTSFVGSLGLTVRDNNGVSDVGVVLNFTLKGVPRVSLPVGFDVNSVENQLTQ